MTYCVVYRDGWRVALLAGRHKDVMPGAFRTVRAACREAERLNMALWAYQKPQDASEAAA